VLDQEDLDYYTVSLVDQSFQFMRYLTKFIQLGDGNSSPNQSQHQLFSTNNENNKGLGIGSNGNNNNNIASSTGGIRSGMASLGLTPSTGSSINNENISSSTDRSNGSGVNNNNNSTNNSNSTTGNSNASRMAGRRNRRV
jgi:hypothetical protein